MAVDLAAQPLEESASASRLKENISMKSATSSPRPKLKGNRSAQSVTGAASTMSTGKRFETSPPREDCAPGPFAPC